MKAKVAVAQMDCVVGDVEANLQRIAALASEARSEHQADLVIFPECATTGYFVGENVKKLAEPANGPTNGRLAELAARVGCHLAVGVIEREDTAVFDSLAVFGPKRGLISLYRKLHLFAGEKGVFTPGRQHALVETELGVLGLTICYDLIFPEYIRGLALAGAELIVNSTDWITDAWQTSQGWSGATVRSLCQIRALENGVHVAMADRVGVEAGWTSLGYSTITSPAGSVLAGLNEGQGVAAVLVAHESEDAVRWRSIATYLSDRRPDIYAAMLQDPTAAPEMAP